MTATTCARGCMSQRKLRRSDARPLRASPADGNVTAQPVLAQRGARVGGSTARRPPSEPRRRTARRKPRQFDASTGDRR